MQSLQKVGDLAIPRETQALEYNSSLGVSRNPTNKQSPTTEEDKCILRPAVKGKFLYVGGEKLFVMGASYGAFRPDAAGNEYQDWDRIENDFAGMAAHGFNTVRIPHTMPPRRLLDIAQRHGLRVMVGLSAEQYVGFLIDKRKAAPDIEGIVRAKVRTVAGHPALLCYAIGNEIAAPVARWLGRRCIEGYLRRVYQAIKAEDPNGIVTYVNYPSTEYLQLPFLDVVCFNVYLESRDRFKAYLARLQNLAGDRPLIMSEVGLDAMRNGETKQAEVLRWQVEESFAGGCAGVVIFSWTDEWHRAGAEVEDWAFGLTDRQRKPKPALKAVQLSFAEMPVPRRLHWPRISVVVCTYNGSRTIRACLEGLGGIQYPDFEVIVVDDGSTDSTSLIAGVYNCRLITTENRGLSEARNVGLKAATGEIVAYTDDDAVPDPHWLAHLANAFLNTSHAGVGGPNLAPPWTSGMADCVDNAPGNPVHVLHSDEVAEHLPGCNMAFRKSYLLELGGFDPQFRTAGDDVDLCWRMQERGWTLGFCPAAVVWHHRRDSIRAFWRQQFGYGRAEAMLEVKWPEKYNCAGHLTYSGRVYGKGVSHALFQREHIYHGLGGFAPFQSLYERSPGTWALVMITPEWFLMTAALSCLSALGIFWRPLLVSVPLLLAAVALSLTHAVIEGNRASFTATPRSAGKRLSKQSMTALLHLLQPLARLCGRMRLGLTAWRHRGADGFAWPWWRSTAVWTKDWIAPEQRLHDVERALRNHRAIVYRGGDYDRWDLEVVGGLFGSMRMLMAIEDHGAGTQYVRVRSWPRLRPASQAILLWLGALLALASLDQAWVVVAILGPVGVLLLHRTIRQLGRATAALLRALHHTGAAPKA